MLVSILVISVIGTFLHFLYGLSNKNKIVGLFAAVNESTWEHIKIGLTPTFLWGLIDGFIYGGNANYFPAKFLSLLSIIIVIPLLFYFYKSFTKKAILPLDIIIFYVSIAVSQFVFNYIIGLNPVNYIYSYLSCIGVFLILIIYMIFTMFPLENFIFKDPITGKYGYRGHPKFHHHHHSHEK